MRSTSAAFFLIAAAIAPAQVITTVAGTDWLFPQTPIRGVDAPFGQLTGVATDQAGNIYLSDTDNCIVFKLSPNGTLTSVAGNGIFTLAGIGGAGSQAALPGPRNIASAPDGTLYIRAQGLVFKLATSGILTRFAGNGVRGFSGDGGLAVNAQIRDSGGIAADASGNVYLAEVDQNVVRKIDAKGIITTIVGNGGAGSGGDNGLGTNAQVNIPGALAVDAAGNLFIAEGVGSRIRKLTPAGIITTATLASNPASIAVDAFGAIYYIGGLQPVVYKIPAGGTFQTQVVVAGNGTSGYTGDNGPATSASISNAIQLAIDSNGNLILADAEVFRVRKVASGIITTIAGNGNYRFAGDGQPGVLSPLNRPFGVAVDNAGSVYISEDLGNRIRKLTGGILTTIAGNGTVNLQLNGDGGQANQASLFSPHGMSFDIAGNLFFAERGRGTVRKIAPNGVISTVATSILADDVSPDRLGNLFISDAHGRVFKSDQKNPVTPFAGNGTNGFGGDNGPALLAMLNNPQGTLVDPFGIVYIGDTTNARIRVIGADGNIRTFAGGGTAPITNGALATNVRLTLPVGMALEANGNLLFTDGAGVRRVTPGGIISNVAGGGGPTFIGDGGAATSASLSNPQHVAVDAAGNIYIADTFNHRVRAILATPPAFSVSPTGLAFQASSFGAVTTPQTLTLSGPITGLLFNIKVDTKGSGNWLSVSPTSGGTPRLVDVVVNPALLTPGTYQATITILPVDATPSSIAINVTLTVGPAQPPLLSVDRNYLSFTFPAGGAARAQTLNVSNQGGGQVSFTAAVTGAGFSAAPLAGVAAAGQAVAINVTADPTGLGAGTYTGALSISGSTGSAINLPLTMTVSANPRAILLSQSGLAFTAVEQGGVVPSQSFAVLNVGAGAVSFAVKTSTLTGGSWLAASASASSTDPTQPAPTITVSVSPAGLKAGTYYGQVRVDAPGAANTPQVVTAVLQVLPAGSDPGALIEPSELVFNCPVNASPGSQELFIYNVSGAAKTFALPTQSFPGLTVAVLPGTGIAAPNSPQRVLVQPLQATAAPGSYTYPLTFQFSDGRVRSVRLTFVITAAASPGSDAARGASGCTPTTLTPALTTLGASFQVAAGFPVGLVADVRDDCGSPLTAGAVSVAFSNGDPPLALQTLKNGQWSATWQSGVNSKSQVTLTVTATDSTLKLNGTRQVSGELLTQQDPPVVTKDSVVSAATPQSYVPLAPGGLFTIFGSRLADSTQQFVNAPLPTQLGATQVIMAGQPLPLLYAASGQINAIVPVGLATNTTHQVLVQRGTTYSIPVPVEVAAAQPGAFEVQATGQAIVQVFRSGIAPFLASPQTPAAMGDVVVLYCAGLGATIPLATDGAVSPPAAQTASPVTVTIGGQPAPVAFSGLVSGFVGLYQVNTVIPTGIAAGDAVPITISVAGQTSPQLTTSVR